MIIRLRSNGTIMLEVNLDAIVGPTHHFSGLGVGNLASKRHRNQPSYPRRAALQGLEKAFIVAQHGAAQFVLPPLFRPDWAMLQGYGFQGSPQEQLRLARQEAPDLLSAVFSSAFMWAANLGTVTSAGDSRDQRLHLTVANLISSLHRSNESWPRLEQLRQFFAPLRDRIRLHPPLPAAVPLRDEGAANHMRLTSPGSNLGLNVFVHGDDPSTEVNQSRLFPRHTLAASQSIARIHQLAPESTFFLQQHPEAISAGAFHNDVIATSHRHLLLHHELAFAPTAKKTLEALDKKYLETFGYPLQRLVIRDAELALSDAISSYLFNCQIISPGTDESPSRGQDMLMICPTQCNEIPAARELIDRWLADPQIPIQRVQFVELRESMAGGGGPACLRLRIPLQSEQLDQLPPRCRLDRGLFDDLSAIIERLYPEELQIEQLAEWDLVVQSIRAVEAINRRVGLQTEK
jgi:succinylarginine dihydrolase